MAENPLGEIDVYGLQAWVGGAGSSGVLGGGGAIGGRGASTGSGSNWDGWGGSSLMGGGNSFSWGGGSGDGTGSGNGVATGNAANDSTYCPDPNNYCSNKQKELERRKRDLRWYFIMNRGPEGALAYRGSAREINRMIRQHNAFCKDNSVSPMDENPFQPR